MTIFLDRLGEFSKSGVPLKLDDAFAALTNGKALPLIVCFFILFLLFLVSLFDMAMDTANYHQTLLKSMPLAEASTVSKLLTLTRLSETPCCKEAKLGTY